MNELINGDFREFLLEVILERSGVKVYKKYKTDEIEGLEDEICAICMDPLNDRYVYKLKCDHIYHRKCMLINIIGHNRYGCELCKAKEMANFYPELS